VDYGQPSPEHDISLWQPPGRAARPEDLAHEWEGRIGAEFNAELERGRAMADGLPPDKEPFTELRDTRKLPAE